MNASSERYEGLNLPQLLDLMHGIVLPEPVSWLPETPGWWVLLGWLTALALLAALKFRHRYRRNRYRRASLALLASIDPDGENAAAEIAAVIKRTALAVYPRQEVAALHGSAWAEFLCHSSANDPAVERGANLIAQAAYRSDVDASAIAEPAIRWVKVHRA